MPPARIALWILSLGVIALAARAVLVAPVPLWIAVCVGVFYASYIALGVMVMRLEMFGDAVWVGETNEPHVALTFDDGPSPETTPKVLDALARAGRRATFFVIGSKVERHPEIARRIVEEGHEIGVHSHAHEWLYVFKTPAAVERDIRQCQDTVERATQVRPKLFRPPVGLMSPRVAAGVRRAGVVNVGWSVRTRDGVRSATKEKVLRSAVSGLDAGSILLLHDAAERDDFVPVITEILPELLERIESAGYRVVPLRTLLGQRDHVAA